MSDVNGNCKIPKSISRINLIPKAARTPGINSMKKAIILILISPFYDLEHFPLTCRIEYLEYLSRYEGCRKIVIRMKSNILFDVFS